MTKAIESLAKRLPKDPETGTLFKRGHDPRLLDFEFLGLGVHSYIAHLHRSRFFFMLLALLSVSSLVANGYGEELANKQINVATWLFTGTSLGNADVVSPSYGATELLITFLMTVFLYWAKAALDSDARRVEQNQVTPADFGVMILNLPRDLAGAPVQRAIESALSIGSLANDASAAMAVVVALDQRALILKQRELSASATKLSACKAAIRELTDWQGKNQLTQAGAARLVKLQTALKDAEAVEERLLEQTEALVATLGRDGPRCAGVAFVTFSHAKHALSVLARKSVAIPGLSADFSDVTFPVKRPPEPSDVIWENLGCTDGLGRQLRGTIYMLLLSLAGAFLIGASAYLQPKATEINAAEGKSVAADLSVMVIGTVVLLWGYLVVFITVPIVEVQFMRHTTVTGKEASQVLKLVTFQVMATISTIGSFAADTAGSFNRDWYITGGFMLVNGMFVDLFVITCLIQGWGLMLNVSRLFIAPSALTQAEMNAAYAGDGATMCKARRSSPAISPRSRHSSLVTRCCSSLCGMTCRLPSSLGGLTCRLPMSVSTDVVDRLQLVTKFVVMCYICSAAIPLLHWVVLLVLTISIAVDETNLLRRLYPAPQSDDTVVRVILVFVMPLAVLLHILAARVFFSQLRAPSTGVSLSAEFHSPVTYPSNATLSDYLRSAASAFGHVPTTSFGSEDEDGLNFVLWSTWVNGPLAMIFIIREWPRFFWCKADSAEATEPDEGSTSQAHSTNAAFNLRHADLEAIYRKAGRESELMYAPPDTSTLVAKLKRTEASPRGLSSAAPSGKPASPSSKGKLNPDRTRLWMQ